MTESTIKPSSGRRTYSRVCKRWGRSSVPRAEGTDTARIAIRLALLALPAALPAQALADPAWTCSAGSGWVAAPGSRATAPAIGGDPCPVARGSAAPAAGDPGSVAADGTLAVDGGAASQTTDTRKPSAAIDAGSLTIENADGSLVVTASKLRAQASGSCDANRHPAYSSGSSLGTVTVDGRPVDTSHDYSEPGVGVNGAPLFGKITIKFGEVAQSGDSAVTRRALHVIVTDREGAIVFEGVGGEVAVGRDGSVCDPPPVCPPGQQPQAGRCVDVQVAPLPPPPPPAPPLPPSTSPGPSPSPGGGTKPPGGPSPRKRRGCTDTKARVGQVSARRLRAATFCLLNVQRKKHHLSRLRMRTDLTLAATRHARAMVTQRFFEHDEPSGPSFLDRILHSGYLQRYGSWHVGENLGWGWGSGGTPAAMVRAWMRSPPHRRNVLYPGFHDVGIAVRAGAPQSRARRQSITYVVDFGGFGRVRR
ncbi:MAG: choice-of-anchor P family protein [Thermoleophilaceae bacterium]